MISKLLYITCSQDPKGVSQALAQSFAQAQASGELNVRRIGRLWPLLLMRAARFCGVSPIEIWKENGDFILHFICLLCAGNADAAGKATANAIAQGGAKAQVSEEKDLA